MNVFRNAITVVLISLLLAACDSAGSHDGMMMKSGGPMMNAVSGEMRSAPGFKLAEQYCSECHAAPNPQQHSAGEWPSVVARMLDNMRRLGKPVPGQQDTGRIIDYLQQYAKPG